MARIQSRDTLLPWLKPSHSELRTRFANPKYWRSASFSIPSTPVGELDTDVVEHYYRTHFAPADNSPDQNYAKQYEFRAGSSSSLQQREVRQPAASPASIDNLSEKLRLAKIVAMKRNDPAGHPTMTVREVAHALTKSRSTIYRMLDEGSLKWSKVRGRILTKDIESIAPQS